MPTPTGKKPKKKPAKPKTPAQRITYKSFTEALEKSCGHLEEAADILGVHRNHLGRLKNRDAKYQEIYDEAIRNNVIRPATQHVFRFANQGVPWAIRFILMRHKLAASEGWILAHSAQGEGGGESEVTIEREIVD